MFRSGRTDMAMQRYRKVSALFSYIDNFKEVNKGRARDLKVVCDLKRAVCLIIIQDFLEARASCDNVLKDDAQNSKPPFQESPSRVWLKQIC